MKFYNLLVLKNVLTGTYNSLQKIIVLEHIIYSILLIRQILTFTVIITTTKKNGLWEEYKKIPYKKHFKLILFAFLNGTCGIMLYFALLYIPINMFSLIEQTLVISVSIFMGIIFLKEKINKYIIIGFIIALIGLSLIVTKGTFTLNIPIIGLCILFVYSFLMGFASILSNKLIKDDHVSSLLFTMSTNFYRLIFYIPLPFLFGEKIIDLFTAFEWYHWLILLFAACCVFIVDYIGAVVTNHISYTVRQLSILIIPTVSSFIGMFIMSEWFIFIQYFGFFLILIGLGFIFINKNKN